MTNSEPEDDHRMTRAQLWTERCRAIEAMDQADARAAELVAFIQGLVDGPAQGFDVVRARALLAKVRR